MPPYDAVVVGLGAMGSAALAGLAGRGARVLGLEQFAPGHDRGSSAGATRIIRKAYFESPAYVPLLERAYELWRDLEAATGTTLLDLCGILMAGRPDGPMATGVGGSSERYGVTVERLDAAAVGARFPSVRLRDDEIALFEPGAGVVFCELGIAAHLQLASERGAHVRGNATVRGWARRGANIFVSLADGSEIETARVVVTAGPWLGELMAELHLPLRVQRNVQIFFAPASGTFSSGRFPAFFLEREGLPGPLYGFPDYGNGLKAAIHGVGETTRADSLHRQIEEGDIALVRDALAGFLPGAVAAAIGGKACMYTWTPDGHFAIGFDPRDPAVAFAGGFSGHGYKFAPVIGEIMTGLALDRRTPYDIEFLNPSRWRSA